MLFKSACVQSVPGKMRIEMVIGNTERNPRWWKLMSLFKWAVRKETCDDHRGFRVVFRWDHFESHLLGNGLYHAISVLREKTSHVCARACALWTHTYIHTYHTKLRLHWYTGVDIEAGASSPTATDSPTGGTSGATGLGRGPGVVGCMVGRGTRRGWKWTKAMQYLQITIQNNLSNMSAWFVAQGV